MLSCDLLIVCPHSQCSLTFSHGAHDRARCLCPGEVLQLHPTQQAKEATGDFKSKFLKSALRCYILNVTDCGNYRVQGKQMQGIFPCMCLKNKDWYNLGPKIPAKVSLKKCLSKQAEK